MKKPSLLSKIADLTAPRLCCNCDRRLTPSEDGLCTACMLALPRTDHARHPEDNEMARLLWRQMDLGRAASLVYYRGQSPSVSFIYRLKYRGEPLAGTTMGRLAAQAFMEEGFFDGIDTIIPVPLAAKRQRERGYNQAAYIARGISEATLLPVAEHVVRRKWFRQTQTRLSAQDRKENVRGAFEPYRGHWWRPADDIRGQHVLLVDDVITTGATLIACAQAVAEAGPKTISVLTLAYAHG